MPKVEMNKNQHPLWQKRGTEWGTPVEELGQKESPGSCWPSIKPPPHLSILPKKKTVPHVFLLNYRAKPVGPTLFPRPVVESTMGKAPDL